MAIAIPKNEYYTYADYATWPDDVRYELIEGTPYMMSPAPNRIHQEIIGFLSRELGVYLKGKSCKVYAAPFDVRLNANEEDDTVVQPDIMIICDKEKLDDKGIVGAPDMVVEILSPSTGKHDRIVKYRLYEKYGVREYWIVDPNMATVEKYLLKDGEYRRVFDTEEYRRVFDTEEYRRVFDAEEYRVRVEVLDDCIIDFAEVFEPDETDEA